MSQEAPLSWQATADDYRQLANTLFSSLQAGDEAARWKFKWLYPRYRGKPVSEVDAATHTLADAELVVANDLGFESFADLIAFATDVAKNGPARRFEAAADAVVSGDLPLLRSMLNETPDLIRARSPRRHHATLLHYVAANGVEGVRQTTPPNALEVARTLLEAGAEADALADMYDEQCTTMSMLVSSSHPAEAGLQAALAEMLLTHGAAPKGPGSKWRSPVLTALTFGFPNTAEALARRLSQIDHFVEAAGLGRLDDAKRLLPAASADERHAALALASQLGRTDVVRLLLDAGEDPNRFNPEDFHSHSTPLHQAALVGHLETVRLLVERGAKLDVKDKIYESTPLGWALHGEQKEVADFLRSRS